MPDQQLNTKEFTLRVAGVGLTVTAADPTFQMCLPEAVGRFLTNDTGAEISIRAGWGALTARNFGAPLFDSRALWQIYRTAQGYLFRFHEPRLGAQPYKTAHFNEAFTQGEIVLHRDYFSPTRAEYPLEYPLDELLVINALAAGRGVEIHACGLLDEDGQGYLFVGQSGAGKTTTARLWLKHTRARILSDDRIILRCEAGRLRMYGTPWHGEAELALAEAAPLDRVFFLQQWPGNEIVSLSRAEAAARFFACGFPAFYRPGGVDCALNCYEQVTRLAPCAELRWRPEPEALELVRRQEV